ncbi:hypothetical protein HUJ04_006981 [Dendroctonus ponderosae]|nr:hypothetical protein HUJ04_006981 [Dendroctonus ponderosae]
MSSTEDSQDLDRKRFSVARSRKLSNYSQAMSHYETMSERICTEIKRIICSSVAGVGMCLLNTLTVEVNSFPQM